MKDIIGATLFVIGAGALIVILWILVAFWPIPTGQARYDLMMAIWVSIVVPIALAWAAWNALS